MCKVNFTKISVYLYKAMSYTLNRKNARHRRPITIMYNYTQRRDYLRSHLEASTAPFEGPHVLGLGHQGDGDHACFRVREVRSDRGHDDKQQ